MSSAEYSYKLFKPIFAYRQTVWTLIRLLLEEQSDLGPHCLQKWLLKSQAEDKAYNIVVIGSLRVNSQRPNLICNRWNYKKIFSCFSENFEFKLRLSGPVNSLGSCQMQSVNIFTLFLGRLSPLSPELVHIILSVTDKCTSWITGSRRMTVEIISWSISMKIMWLSLGSNSQALDLQSDTLPNMLWSLAIFQRK